MPGARFVLERGPKHKNNDDIHILCSSFFQSVECSVLSYLSLGNLTLTFFVESGSDADLPLFCFRVLPFSFSFGENLKKPFVDGDVAHVYRVFVLVASGCCAEAESGGD